MSTATAERAATWSIDPTHTDVAFAVRHMGLSTVRGRFDAVSGTVATDETGAPTDVRVEIETASIVTGTADRDAHLRSADFFDADNNPTITFTSTKVERDGTDWEVTGDLTIKGVSKPVTIVFEENGSAQDPFGNVRIGFEGQTAINRKDWDLTWNAALETGGVLVSEKIKLEFDVSAIKNA